MILITGGTEFIGGNFVHHWFERRARLNLPHERVVVLDKLTDAGNPATIQTQIDAGDAILVHADFGDGPAQTFESRIDQTVRWYLTHNDWVDTVRSGAHAKACTTEVATPPAINTREKT